MGSLALAKTLFPDLPPTYLCSSESLSWILPAGGHCLPLPGVRPQHCGLIPILGDTVVSTTGLQWNLTQGRLRFGELVSTSNGFCPESSEVAVLTDKDVLWTMDCPIDGSIKEE